VLFNSFPFIFAFLPFTLAIFVLLARVSHALAASWLTAASLLFYAWWDYRYVGLLVASIAFNYLFGVAIARATESARRHRSRALLTFAVVVNLVVLGYFKYANFFLESVGAIAGTRWGIGNVVLPLGISFFTFTQIAFLVDAYRGLVTSYHPVHYALFVTYFPHLIAGPILHHKDMIRQFAATGMYRLEAGNLAVGTTVFTMGLFKKVVIADTMASFSTPAFAAAADGQAMSFVAAWGGVLAYTFQLYFDFSGYSDMAIGISRMFGIHLPLNFDSPYKATSIIDFWRRWHMTLSRFLRDYLYVPLGGNRHHPSRRYVNLMITMLLGGLWHGAGWTFVAWGALHGVYLMVNHGWRSLRGSVGGGSARGGRWGEYVSRSLTFLAVIVGWVFFRAGTFTDAVRMLQGMTGVNGFSTPSYFAEAGNSMAVVAVLSEFEWIGRPTRLLVAMFWILVFFVVWLAPNTQQIMGCYNQALDPYPGASGRPVAPALRWRPTPTMAIAAALVFFISLVGLLTDRPSEFLYFQF